MPSKRVRIRPEHPAYPGNPLVRLASSDPPEAFKCLPPIHRSMASEIQMMQFAPQPSDNLYREAQDAAERVIDLYVADRHVFDDDVNGDQLYDFAVKLVAKIIPQSARLLPDLHELYTKFPALDPQTSEQAAEICCRWISESDRASIEKKIERLFSNPLASPSKPPIMVAKPTVELISAKQAARRAGLDVTTITRRCNAGKVPGAVSPKDSSNTTGGWLIPESSIEVRKGDDSKKVQKPKLPVAAIWECVECEHEITAKAKPSRCPKCGKHTFTRKSTKPSVT